ncbi:MULTISPECIES: hypothetical protein [unclassified Flavobacterium]|uniref:DUF6934 family protein n=1 Tax=unclassified Flavobacterium TaxID=196869 RepID=UPI001E422FD5|nr:MULTISPECIES: hypothetical protein [unclassified Flavobacterium]
MQKKDLTNIDIYETSLSIENSIVQYLFESAGDKKIIKAVQYSRFETQNGVAIYNLGFGDYNFETKDICDKENSNNGDMRNVFNTVLGTVPKFFEDNPGFPIYVQGSDSSESFEEECRNACSKNCYGTCKNKNRRIRTYTYFVDKYFKELSKEYIFFGFDEEENNFVQYVPKNKYIAVLVYKKK